MFLWRRFTDLNEYMGSVGVYEKPNTQLMKMVVDHYTDEPEVVEVSEQLMTKRQHVIDGDGQQYQEYKQKDLKTFAPEGYRGSTAIGRSYTNSLFQRLPARILNTVYKGTHVGVDMSSSFSTMLATAFRDVELSFFNVYARTPQVIYDHFADLGVGRALVKTFVNGSICAWPSSFNNEDISEIAELSRDEMVMAMRDDLHEMSRLAWERYPKFMEMVKAKCCGESPDPRHVDGTGLFYLASDMEHSVMRVVIQHLFGGTQLSDVIWKYDGIVIPMYKISGRRHEDVLQELETLVKSRLDIDVRFKIEDLGQKSFGICLAPEEREEDGDAYSRWKSKFERKFAVLKNPPVFMMFQHGGKSWVDLNKAGFEHVTATEPKEFIKQWHEDPSKRMYNGRDFVPPPLVIHDGYLNTYKGFNAADLPEVFDEDIGLYMRHVDILVGNKNGEHPDYAEYLHNLLAYKFQNPGLQWRVMPIILSAQGVGKDTWFDFVAEIIGEHNTVKGNGIFDFVEKKSGKLEGKLLCCFQEMGKRKVDKEWEEDLKTKITNKHLVLERKHVNEVIVTNVCCFIGFSNKQDAVMPGSDDRRFFIVTADSTYMQDTEYLYPLFAFFGNDRKKRAVYDFYMSRDVSKFDPSADRPRTETQRELVESNVSHVDLFLKTSMQTFKEGWRQQDETLPIGRRDYSMSSGILTVTSKIVMDNWMEYAKANNFKNHENKNSMSQFFNRMLREQLMVTDKYKSEGVSKLVNNIKRKRGNFYEFDCRGIQRYLDSIFSCSEEDDEEREAKRPRIAEWNPNHTPRFNVRQDGEVMFQSDDLEEINKTLGEAYVDEERDVLVNPATGREYDLGEWYTGEHRYARIEAKFPFYVRDRMT